MTIKYATGSCHYCYIRLPKPKMHKSTIQVKSGRSSGSWGIGRSLYGKKRRKATHLRYNAGRTYYKNKNIWSCTNCYVKNHPSDARAAGIESKQQIVERERKVRQQIIERKIKEKKKIIKSLEYSLSVASKLITRVEKQINENKKKFSKTNIGNISLSIRQLGSVSKTARERLNSVSSNEYKVTIDRKIENLKSTYYSNCPNLRLRFLFRLWTRPILWSTVLICVFIAIFNS